MMKPMRVIHGIVFLVGLLISILVFVVGYDTELMIIFPAVINTWILVHLLLGLVQLLDWLGRKRTASGPARVLPVPMILTIIVYGLGALQGLAMLLFALGSVKQWTPLRMFEVALTVFPVTVFLGLMLRYPWARMLAGGGLILCGVFFLAVYASSIVNQHSRLAWGEALSLAGFHAALIALGIVFLNSPGVRAYFMARKAEADSP